MNRLLTNESVCTPRDYVNAGELAGKNDAAENTSKNIAGELYAPKAHRSGSPNGARLWGDPLPKRRNLQEEMQALRRTQSSPDALPVFTPKEKLNLNTDVNIDTDFLSNSRFSSVDKPDDDVSVIPNHPSPLQTHESAPEPLSFPKALSLDVDPKDIDDGNSAVATDTPRTNTGALSLRRPIHPSTRIYLPGESPLPDAVDLLSNSRLASVDKPDDEGPVIPNHPSPLQTHESTPEPLSFQKALSVDVDPKDIDDGNSAVATGKTTHWRDQLNSKPELTRMLAMAVSSLAAFTLLVAGIVQEKTGAQQVKDADKELNDAEGAQKTADVEVAQARSEKYSHEGEMAANLAVDKQIEHDRDEYQNAQAAGDKDKMAEIASHYNLQADGHTPDFSQGGFKDIETYRTAGYENGVRTARNVAVSSATKTQETAEERYKSAVERKESATRVKEVGDGLLGVAVPLSVITLLAGFAEFKLAKRTSMNETQQINNSDPNILKDNGLHKSFSSMSTGISI